eukprot:tig00000254_g22537.t1
MNWGLTQDPLAQQFLAMVREVAKVRMDVQCLRRDFGAPHYTMEDGGSGRLAFKRSAHGTTALVVVNPSEGQWENCSFNVATGEPNAQCVEVRARDRTGGNQPAPRAHFVRRKEVFNSQAAPYGGWEGSGNAQRGAISAGGDGKIAINLPKWSLLIFVKS